MDTTGLTRHVRVRTQQRGIGAEARVGQHLAALIAQRLHVGSRGIGLFFGWAGQAMLLAGLAWAAWMVWRRKAKLSDSLFAESEER